MGRALKIQKNNVGAGTTVSGSNPVVTTYNQTVLADAGFPNFGSLTNPAFNTPVQTLDRTQFLGVVGGSPATSTASATFPEVAALVNILLVDGTDSQTATSSYTGRLIRQKGSHKFLVAATGATIADEDMLVGQAYQIASLGSTNWQAVGAGTNVAVGDIFTCTADAGAGTGTVFAVGQCVLSNTATPTAGNMSIQYSTGDSAAVFASYITNKWVRDWNGMTYGNYSNSNFGQNIQSNENQYVANFFTDEGNVTVSGGELSGTTSVDNPTIQLAQIASVTS
ncbi:hypothetical protein [Haliscomenobacter sp.]|uniref:hypothetical protein n=1 Tax=Haliscomenobacter sp. TaxID=2717303 RepID=UPI003364E872